jgi:hypothetical protein
MLRENQDITSSDSAPPANSLALDEGDDGKEEGMLSLQDRNDQRRELERAKDRGICVVSAF